VSSIGAKSFYFYEGKKPPSHLTLSEPNYFQHENLHLPKKGLTMLYGNRGPGNLIGAAVRHAAENEIGIGLVEAKVNIGEWSPDKARLDGFSRCRVLNLPARASKEVMDDVNKRWNTWLALEGLPPEKFPRKPSLRMDFLDKLVEQEPYSQLNAIVFDAMSIFGLARFVTIYNMDAIDYDSIVVIPRNLTKVDFEIPG
jgi:hypothetical protein